ncbi:uncharacterized protein LOC122862134 isoform X2 [Siniperca chuatsi]|nr:uncharacterized protein LOC122862134 isoform X2 [Siniperca chuatsi]
MDYKPSFVYLPGSTQLRLQASPEAARAARQSRQEASEPLHLKSAQRAEADAWGRVTALGGDPADRRHILSRTEVLFGRYRGRTFQWLLTHDVGYAAAVLASHEKECEGGDSSGTPVKCNKDSLLEYARLFPAMAAAIADKQRTDAEGDRLVGFGTYRSLTYRQLYETVNAKLSNYRNWVRQLTVNAGCQLAQLQQYVVRRDEEPQQSVVRRDKKLQQSVVRRDEELQQSVVRRDEEPQQSVVRRDEELQQSVVRRDEELQQSVVRRDEEPQQSVVRRDEEPQQSVVRRDKKLQQSDSASSAVAASPPSSTARSTGRSPSARPACSSRAVLAPSAPSTSSSTAQRAASPPPQRPRSSSSTARKRKARVLSNSSEDEDDRLEAAGAEQETAAPASSPPPLPPPPPPVPGRAPPPPPAPPAQLLLPAAWRRTLPVEQQEWVSKALFVKDQTGRAVLSQELQLWYNPPGPQLVYSQRPSTPDAFFQRPFFFWAPYRMWQYHLKCPNCAHKLTGCGIYKTVRKVLDLDGWYYMATEYLECRSCKKKVAGWAECVRKQLDVHHQQLFPAVLAYKISCDRKVLAQMKGRTLGNSVSRLRSFLVEQHTAEWMRRGTHYLHTCWNFKVPGVQMPRLPALPKMEPVPSNSWLLSTYTRDSFTRIEELRAKVTSTFGSILKMNSTKKVTRKLAGADAGTTQWMTSVGNELGQVLMSVLTAAEGYGLRDMAKGLQERYQRAGKDPPHVLYVNSGCCSGDGGTCAATALFPAWAQMSIRLDIRHFLRRLAAGVTSESHPLYPDFMRSLSGCIFEWDPEDLSRLRRTNVMSVKEMSRHCRRRTRGAQETERLLDETVEAFMGATDTMNIPLLDRDRMKEIWSTQRKHITCIQDPPGVHLHTRTGQVTKGGVTLPVYRCARGSASLESFHMHLNRFIPGTTARECYFQIYLLEGLTRWNQDRAQAAAGGASTGTKCYSGQEQHNFNKLTQHFYGLPLAESYTEPLEYTGELIGISYLYGQSGRTLQDFPDGSEELNVEEEEEEEELLDNLEEVVGDEEFDNFRLDCLDPLQQPPPQQQLQPPPQQQVEPPQPEPSSQPTP